MKKLFVILLVAGSTSILAACNSNNSGPTTTATQESEQMDGGMSSPNPTVSNDTTGTAATEKTQTKVGNSNTRGETNDSKSRTTQNVEVRDSAQ